MTGRRFDAPPLDGLRAVAFAIVFASHVPGLWFFPGGFGVTVFFFLSGYLITTLLRLEVESAGRIDVLAFFARRFLRILPPYFLVLAVVWGLASAGAFGAPGSWGLHPLLWQAGFLTNYWLVGHGAEGLPPGTEVYWSLAVEEHFYLGFPFVAIALFRWVEARYRGPVLLLCCAAVLLWRLSLDPGSPDRLTYASDTRIDSILYGCVLAVMGNPVLDGPLPGLRRARTILAAAVLGLVLTLVPRDPAFRETLRYSLQGLLLMPVYAVVLTRPDLLVVRVLVHPWLRRLGALSYTLYLVHYSMIELVHRALPHAPWLAVGAIAAVGSVGFAEAMHRLVERPLARLRARLRVIETRSDGER